MTQSATKPTITVGVLALQGAFSEHIQLLRHAATAYNDSHFDFMEIRNPAELATCDALIVPGGESTAISLVAARSGMLEPLREFVKFVSHAIHTYTDMRTRR
jgi:5'-phosphate synthase pdxT subunit